MPAAVYYSWDRAGRPLEPAQPIRDMVDRLKVAYPRAASAHLFGWYADESHYQAVPPQDHTPYSQTGWPLPSPQWVVFATDVMHRKDLGVDCAVLFSYWIGEARAGRMPWLKYIIWEAKLYTVRTGWRAEANTGHYDHIHLSARTDHRTTSLGAWSVVPMGDDVTLENPDKAWVNNSADGIARLTRMDDTAQYQNSTGVEGPVEENKLVTAIKRLGSDVTELKARPPVQSAPVDPATLKAALLDPEVLAAIGKAVIDEDHRRSAE